MNQNHLILLQAMPIFGATTAATLEFLCSASSEVEVPKGQYFFHENDEAQSMFVLETGEISILKDWQGSDFVLRYLGAGDCFGEMSLVEPGRRSASALAVAHCTALEITAQDLFELYSRDLEQFTLIYMNIARELSRRLRDSDRRYFEMKVEPRHAEQEWTYHSV